jgi:hypothetical protein
MAWAWCLPCGFRDVVPYFYVVYFGVLLVHRDQRDQEACREKYGKDWDAYCAIVRWRFCPYVYCSSRPTGRHRYRVSLWVLLIRWIITTRAHRIFSCFFFSRASRARLVSG